MTRPTIRHSSSPTPLSARCATRSRCHELACTSRAIRRAGRGCLRNIQERSLVMTTKRILMLACMLLMLSTAQARGGHGREDAVLEWNRIAFDEVLNAQPPPEQMRFAAILHLAVFEGVNAVTEDYNSTVDTLYASRGASASAAAIGAAHRVL